MHRVVDKAATVVAEDLTKTFAGRKPLGKNINRRLAAWTKGVTAEALTNVSERRGSALVLRQRRLHLTSLSPLRQPRPTAAGTGFTAPRAGSCGRPTMNAAINILHRHGDPDIALHTPHRG